jgi:hypothetical protein
VSEGRINDSIVALDATVAGGVVGSSLQVLNSQNYHQPLEHLTCEVASLIVHDGPGDAVMHDPTLVRAASSYSVDFVATRAGYRVRWSTRMHM